MANVHINGSTEIDNSDVTLTDILDKLEDINQYRKTFETKRYYTNDGRPGWYKVLNLGSSAGYGNKSILVHMTPTIGMGGGSCLAYITYYNNGWPELIRLAGNLFTDRFCVIRDSNYNLSLYMKTVDWYRPILVTVLSGMFNQSQLEYWGGLFNGCGYIGDTLPSGTQINPTTI